MLVGCAEMDDMTRIIAGVASGTSLKVPASGTRPTSERVREALFGALDARGEIDGARTLDLFAGTGALGLEAASRGASSVVLVELARQAVQIAKQNASAVAKRGACEATVVAAKAQKFLAESGAEFDLVFIDPPYDLARDVLAEVLELLAPRLSDDAVVALEQAKRAGEPPIPETLEVLREKSYGDTMVYTLMRAQAPTISE